MCHAQKTAEAGSSPVYLWKLRNLQPHFSALQISASLGCRRGVSSASLTSPDTISMVRSFIMSNIKTSATRGHHICRYLDREHIYEPTMRVVAVMSRRSPTPCYVHSCQSGCIKSAYQVICISKSPRTEKKKKKKHASRKHAYEESAYQKNQGGRTEIKCKKMIMESHESPVTSSVRSPQTQQAVSFTASSRLRLKVPTRSFKGRKTWACHHHGSGSTREKNGSCQIMI